MYKQAIKQIKKHFKNALKSEFAIIVNITYEENNASGDLWWETDTEVGSYENVRVLYDVVDELNLKKYPYADVQNGKTLFFVPFEYNLIGKKNIKVIWNNDTYIIKKMNKHQPLGNEYLCQLLIQE